MDEPRVLRIELGESTVGGRAWDEPTSSVLEYVEFTVQRGIVPDLVCMVPEGDR